MPQKPRVTAKIDDLVKRANRLLALPDASAQLSGLPDAHAAQAFRYGVIAMLEPELINANHYRGFAYQSSEFELDLETEESVLRPGHDDTRRRYF